MTLPFTTTVVRIESVQGGVDKWEPSTFTVTAAEEPAVISSPAPSDVESPQSSQERIDMVLHVNPGVAVVRGGRVTDLTFNETYDVMWVLRRHGLGLDHVRAGLKRVSGD